MENVTSSTAERAHLLFQAGWDKMLAHNKVTPPCCRGCSACCYEPVYVERREAQLIADRVKTMPEPTQIHVNVNLHNWYQTMLATGMHTEVQPPVLPYRAQRLPCPLLNMQTGECTVYSNRPIGCRSHTALHDRRLCESDDLRLSQKFAVSYAGMGEAFAEMLADGGTMEMGHLNEFLCEMLIDTKIVSADRQKAHLTSDGQLVPDDITKLAKAAKEAV